MWVDVNCPRPSCGLNLRINGVGSCVCGALLVYKPSPRRRVLEFDGKQAYQWHQDDDGPERVHPDNGTKILQERGRWLPLPGTRLVFPSKNDGRKTARPGAMPFQRRSA